MKYTKFQNIPPFTRSSSYSVDMGFEYLIEWAYGAEDRKREIPDLDPDFQRGHVWTELQQIRFVEYILRGGMSGRDIYFNHPGWLKSYKGDFVLVDGKQRLQAITRFMRNEIPVFSSYYKEYTDHLSILQARMKVHVNDLATKAEVLQWYIDLNAGGIAHTEDEIQKVQALLTEEWEKHEQ